jgi:hypothetical protein
MVGATGFEPAGQPLVALLIVTLGGARYSVEDIKRNNRPLMGMLLHLLQKLFQGQGRSRIS